MPTSILQSLSFAHPVLNGDIYFGNALPYAWHTLKWVSFLVAVLHVYLPNQGIGYPLPTSILCMIIL